MQFPTVMAHSYLWHDFYKKIFKINHTLFTAPASVRLPTSVKNSHCATWI